VKGLCESLLWTVIPSQGFMVLWLTTRHENALSLLAERVARDGAFTSQSGSGEGVPVRYLHGSRNLALSILKALRDSSSLAAPRNDSKSEFSPRFVKPPEEW
jgi:hypothetical protein